MRTIKITILKSMILIEDWNYAHWRLFKDTDGFLRCTLPGCHTPERYATFYDFLTTVFGQGQIGKFQNYEVKIKGNGQ